MKKKVLGIVCVVLAWSTAHSQCGQYPVLNIGNDTILCQGQSLTLNVPSGYDGYTWNIPPGNQQTATITSPTTVVLNVVNYNNANLVVNGDFEAGNTSFTSGYGYVTPVFNALYPESKYTVTTSPSIVHDAFSICNDVTTSGPGNMMVVNGADDPNVTVWSQTITVSPNTNYSFASWATSVKDLNQLSDVTVLQFFINNVQIGPVFSPTLLACDWKQFSQLWNSGANTSATISIIAQVSGGFNDFALDNITFTEVCPQTDTLVVTYDPSAISAGPNKTFCANELEPITATANFANPNFSWVSGQTGATINPTTSGNYVVQAVSPNGCNLKDTVAVTVKAMPWDFDTVASIPSECGLNTGAVFTLMTGSFIGQPIYTWNGPGANNPNQINASVWQNLSPGWYYIDVANNGCHRKDSILVSPLNPPVANVSANPTSGIGPLSVTFTNGSSNATNYDWYFGNGNTNTTTDLSSQTQTYDSIGTYLVTLVAINGNCMDTATVSVTVIPPIIPPVIVPVDLKTPNIFTPNGDKMNDFFTFELLNIKSLDVTIMNRWGNPVYTSGVVPFSWDGKDASGNMMEEGVYFYKYIAKGAQDEPFEGQGFVQLIK